MKIYLRLDFSELYYEMRLFRMAEVPCAVSREFFSKILKNWGQKKLIRKTRKITIKFAARLTSLNYFTITKRSGFHKRGKINEDSLVIFHGLQSFQYASVQF